MSKELLAQALGKFILGVALVMLLVFGSAGTLCFFNGWLLMGVLFVPMLAVGVVLWVKNPELLKLRLQGKETQKEQDLAVKLSGLMFLAGFIVAGLNVRFGRYLLPRGISVGAAVVFLGAYLLYAEALRENAYLSRTIRVQDGQKVIDTGLNGIVRHPMYSATLLLFWAIPLILGSLWAFVIFLAYPAILAARIRGEEALLEKDLEGYRAYQKQVKYRLIPFVW